MPSKLFRRLRRWTACAFGLAAALPALAQYTSDIDIYSGSSASDPPNVLILLDTTANWRQAYSSETAALINTIKALPANRFRVGLMMFTETGNPNNNIDGGYIRAAIRNMDDAYKPKFIGMLESLGINEAKSNSGKAALTMAEAYYYFTGAPPYAGNQKVKADYAGNTSGPSAASNAIYLEPNNALPSFAGSPYNSPIINGCARNYIIYISNGAAQDPKSDNTNASTRLSAAYAAAGLTRPADLVISPDASAVSVADEWARFMKDSPSNITTYTLDVDPVTNGQGPGWSALLSSMAVQSGGEYFAVSSSGTALAEKLAAIFNQIQAVNSVFSSASLPVSVNSRGTYLNQVFMGMFRPDADAKPRWRGNLKQYQFGYDATNDILFLADSNGNRAISGATGFISTTAISYWTSTSTFWTNQEMGTPLSKSDSPDGEVVEKGGAAQQIRTAYTKEQATRQVYTCLSCATGTELATDSASQFSTANSSSMTAISSDSALRDKIIDWVRGTDNAGDEKGPGAPTTIRPSVHGDVLHSRPAVVNYGGTTGVVVFYGSNDGMLRALNGNKSGTGAGQELWGFIPEEHFPKLKRLRDNTPEVRLSTTTVLDEASPTKPQPRDYFVDGSISVYQKVDKDGNNTKVYLYSTMRRGGRFLYALDVTNPAKPKFLWRHAHTESDFAKLGQTWSEPRIAKLKGQTNPVLVMGGGYDAAAEDLATPGATTMGNAVFVLDAFTGTLIKRFDTDRSVTADVSLMDSDQDGYVDRAYAADLGGNIYRIDFETSSSSNASVWDIYKLATLQSGTEPRKFFFAPDVVPTPTFTAILIGSGDREKPLKETGADAFFTVYDDRMTKGTPSPLPSPITTLGKVGTKDKMDAGCYIELATGEKVVNASTTFRGVTYFGTNKPTPPAPNVCKPNLGEARTYAAPLFCRIPYSEKLEGGGLPPSPVAGFVDVATHTQTNPDGTTTTFTKQKDFIIGAPNPKKSAIETGKSTGSLSVPRKRRYWFDENKQYTKTP